MQSPLTNTDDAAAEKPRKREDRWSLVRFILGLALLAWALRSFVFAPFSIPSGSMLPTLYIGDYLAVSKWPFGYSRYSFPLQIPSFEGRIFSGQPKRGDVVVFRHPAEDSDLIKRVIGLPGDTVEVRGGELILNGQPVKREPLPPFGAPISENSPCKVAPGATPVITASGGRQLCLYSAFRETLPGGPSYRILNQVDGGPADDFPAIKVPAGHVFLMGDNRDDSLDSRFSPAEGGSALSRSKISSAGRWSPSGRLTGARRGSRPGHGSPRYAAIGSATAIR